MAGLVPCWSVALLYCSSRYRSKLPTSFGTKRMMIVSADARALRSSVKTKYCERGFLGSLGSGPQNPSVNGNGFDSEIGCAGAVAFGTVRRACFGSQLALMDLAPFSGLLSEYVASPPTAVISIEPFAPGGDTAQPTDVSPAAAVPLAAVPLAVVPLAVALPAVPAPAVALPPAAPPAFAPLAFAPPAAVPPDAALPDAMLAGCCTAGGEGGAQFSGGIGLPSPSLPQGNVCFVVCAGCFFFEGFFGDSPNVLAATSAIKAQHTKGRTLRRTDMVSLPLRLSWTGRIMHPKRTER